MSKVSQLFLSVLLGSILTIPCFSSDFQLRFGSQRVSDDESIGTILSDDQPSNTAEKSTSATEINAVNHAIAIPERRPLTIVQRQQISQLCRANELPADQCKTHWLGIMTQS